MHSPSYEERVKQQIEQYRHVDDMHELPSIFHYWSNKYLRPKLRDVMEADSIPEFYAEHFRRATIHHSGPFRFASLGAGDCSLEIAVARRLKEAGLSNFRFDCFELSPVLIERANLHIAQAGLANQVYPIPLDLNAWSPEEGSLTAIMANHSLHHMVELETIFSNTCRALRADGVFVTNDMIGRNGHLRWPESLYWIEKIWAFLPKRLKLQRQLNVLDECFVNRDCSTDGFEGIRAQDILPLLVSRFHFSHFFACGGLIDVLVDRGYGHNFDPENAADLSLIDFVESLNDFLLQQGSIKPTIMFAVMSNVPSSHMKCDRKLTPDFAIRKLGSEVGLTLGTNA